MRSRLGAVWLCLTMAGRAQAATPVSAIVMECGAEAPLYLCKRRNKAAPGRRTPYRNIHDFLQSPHFSLVPSRGSVGDGLTRRRD